MSADTILMHGWICILFKYKTSYVLVIDILIENIKKFCLSILWYKLNSAVYVIEWRKKCWNFQLTVSQTGW